MSDRIVSGTIVRHIVFGEGTVISVKNDAANVNFLNFGKKTVLTSYLKVISESVNVFELTRQKEVATPFKINSLTIVDFILAYMEKHNTTKMKSTQCVKMVREQYGEDVPAKAIIDAVDPIFDIVFYKHLVKRKKNLNSNKSENKVTEVTPNVKSLAIEFPVIQNIDDFELACMKEKFDTTIKLFFAREIINFALKIGKPDPINIFLLRDMAENILNVLLRQMSINYFYNDTMRNNPPFYDTVFNFIQDNELSQHQKDESLRLIEDYLKRIVINQFLIVNGQRSENIYLIDKNYNLLFSPTFIKLLSKKGTSLDKRIVSRLKYFISKNNDYSSQLQHYIDYLGKDDIATKDIILKFEYENNLNELSKDLKDDLILKNDFKALMKKYGIPTNENYFKMCMARIDYTLRSKRIILRNKYKSVTAFYREQVLKEDIYRYSNPYNLDEYDIIIKGLLNNFYLIDVGYGVYLTRTNMVKNGLTDDVINDFKQKVIDIVQKTRFICLRELMSFMKDNKVVQYCDGDKKQLIQFIKPIESIGVNELSSGSYILCIRNDKQYKGNFIEFVFGKAVSMDIYDIHDLAKEHFDVEYKIEEIIRDLKHTNLYYSEEMERVYRDKEAFISEVFRDGN